MKDFEYRTVGQKIQQCRDFLGISQTALADELGIARQTLSVIEKDKQEITISQLKKLMTYFHVSADFFIK